MGLRTEVNQAEWVGMARCIVETQLLVLLPLLLFSAYQHRHTSVGAEASLPS